MGGAGEVPALNIFAYDVTTGNPVACFSHSLNAQGLVVRGSADGSRVYVGGDFTTVDGVARGHVAAFDTATGALVRTGRPNVGGQVRALAAHPVHRLRRRQLPLRQRPDPHLASRPST